MNEQGQGKQVSGRVFVTEPIGSVIVSKGKGAHGRVEVVVFSHPSGEVLGRSDVVTLLDDDEPWQTIPLREPVGGAPRSVILSATCEESGGFGEGAVGVLCAGSVQQVAAAALESAGARDVQVARGHGGGAWGVRWTGQDGSDCHLIDQDFAALLKWCVHAEMARAARLGALRETLDRAKARGDLGVVSTPYREGSLMEAMFGGHPLPPAPHLDEVADVMRRADAIRDAMPQSVTRVDDAPPGDAGHHADLIIIDDPHTTTLGGDMTPEAEDRCVYHDTQEDFVEAVCAAIRERYPDTCHVCGGACYKGASVVAEGWEHPVEGTCPPVEAEPEVVSRTTHEMRGEPGCGEWVWQAYGSGVHVKHPLRSGAITAWREALREKGA